jgi:ABC-type glycerol-3-phosphate transport system substrate-binding protein
VQGFAISSGTQFQEQAYALAKYLTLRPEVANNFNSASPARKSLVGVQPTNNNNNGGGGGGGRAFRQTTPEQQALVQQALANGLPDSELRFTDYVATAVDKVNSENTDAHTALQEVEAQANTDLQTADSKKTSNSVVVATPVPEVVLPAGKIALKFAVQSFIEPLPNQDRWDQLIQNFVANDPQVGNVVLDTPGGFGGGGVDQLAQNYDCFYLAYNAVPSITLTSVLSLDPFIDADPTFDKSDVVNNVFPQLQRDNKTWALPIDLEPEGLRYDSDKFSRSNVPAPQDGWTVNAFNDALKALKLQPTDPAPFRSGSPGDTYLLMLMAAYGGLPIDYRTNPPTLNFTDQNNAQAIQQVLDLAKAGYLDYGALTARGDVVIFSGSTQQQADIYSQALNAFGFGLRFRAGGNNNRNQNGNATTTTDTYMLTTYPKGSQFGAATYNLGTGYISATSQNPEACYRWLNTVAHHPDLFSAMPARRSLFDDPTVTGSETPDAIAFYKEIDAVLQDANTITFPSIFGGASAADFLTRRWLDEAFDSYVLKDGDLTSGLSDAQTYATTYQQCTANIPPFDPSTENQRSYRQQIMACATKADPNAAALFGG